MLKVAVVGVGGISGAHIPAWEAMGDVELVALCDVRPEQMEKYSDKHCYTDCDAMLQNETIDILDICLPTFLHADYAVKAMEMGIHVLCEKPVSLQKEDVKRLYETAQKHDVKFMVAQVLRFWPEYEAIKKFYEEGTYGKLLSGTMNRLSEIPGWSWDGWLTDEKRSGLVPFDLHIHDVDYLLYAFGLPKERKVTRVKREDQDYLQGIYTFEGFSIFAEAAWYAGCLPFKAGFRFQFEEAVAEMENGVLTVYEKSGKVYQPVGGSNADTGDIGIPASDAYGDEIRYFTDCVKYNTPTDKVKPEELETVIDILQG